MLSAVDSGIDAAKKRLARAERKRKAGGRVLVMRCVPHTSDDVRVLEPAGGLKVSSAPPVVSVKTETLPISSDVAMDGDVGDDTSSCSDSEPEVFTAVRGRKPTPFSHAVTVANSTPSEMALYQNVHLRQRLSEALTRAFFPPVLCCFFLTFCPGSRTSRGWKTEVWR